MCQGGTDWKGSGVQTPWLGKFLVSLVIFVVVSALRGNGSVIHLFELGLSLRWMWSCKILPVMFV